MSKNLLIVSYTFPPMAGIGGRRWAKFSKYLSRMGYGVTVLCSENSNKEESVWMKDAEGLNVITIPFHFPSEVAFPSKHLLGKIKYRLNVQYLKMRDNGNYFDRTIFWEKQVHEKISEIVNTKKIDCIIVTSGPFRLSLHVVKLKKKFPDIKFIVDFRDLWTEDMEITSFSSLSRPRKQKEKKTEKETVFLADKVISVADELNNYFSSLTIAKKFSVIPNGYDPDDFNDLPVPVNISDDKIRFVFTGTLYINLKYILDPFFEAIAKLKENENGLYKKLQFEFIGRFPEEYYKLIMNYGIKDAFLFTNSLSLKEVYGKIANAHYCMLFLNDVYSFALSTKFCEYISQHKKIIVVSNKGAASNFITENKIGFWVDPRFAFQNLKEIILSTLNKKAHSWDSGFDTKQFSIPHLTKKLAHIIEEKFEPIHTFTKRNLILTFDYELFLGVRSGTVDNCIIRPTNKILELLEKHKFKNAIFFVDTTYIKKLSESEEAACVNDLHKIKQNLIKILKAGHYIFPHLHPYWKDAVYDSKLNQWCLEKTNNYRLHSLSVNEQEELFSFSIKLIEEVKKNADIKYEIDSYRAGGWCLQPFETFKPLFEKFSINNDFSVLRGFKNDNPNLYYDYTAVPLKSIYHFSSAIETEDVNGPFSEISISKISLNDLSMLRSRIFNKYLAYRGVKNFGDGLSVIQTIKTTGSDPDHLGLSYKNSEMISIELLNKVKLVLYKKYILENDFMHFISHPKMLSLHNLKMFDDFLKYTSANFELVTDYKKMIN